MGDVNTGATWGAIATSLAALFALLGTLVSSWFTRKKDRESHATNLAEVDRKRESEYFASLFERNKQLEQIHRDVTESYHETLRAMTQFEAQITTLTAALQSQREDLELAAREIQIREGRIEALTRHVQALVMTLFEVRDVVLVHAKKGLPEALTTIIKRPSTLKMVTCAPGEYPQPTQTHSHHKDDAS